MKRSFTHSTTFAQYIVAIVLVLVPFHAFLTVWGSSLVGHYTALRLWDDCALILLLAIVVYWLARDAALRVRFTQSNITKCIAAYAVLTVILGGVSYARGDVGTKALAYGLLVNLRFLIWFLAVHLVAERSPKLRAYWPRLLLAPAVIVVVFAALQYLVLPHNFLSHFGYDAAKTISPTETINHNAHYLRVQSTLRGANPLGAYLVVVVSTLLVFAVRTRRKVLYVLAGIVGLFALYATGSRSAWIGAIVAGIFVVWRICSTGRQRKLFFGVAAGVLLVFATATILLRNNVSLQNTLLHTQKHSVVQTGSNSAHANALRSGLQDVVQQPFGDGPGTAGQASVYNTKRPARISENYYVQIAQETGWIGLSVFLSIIILIGLALYRQIGQSKLALVLFASLLGLSLVNMLSHAWSDDTLAFVWWGLAGIALAQKVPQEA